MGWGEKLNENSRWYQKHRTGQMPVVSEPIKATPDLGKKKTLWQRIIDYFKGR